MLFLNSEEKTRMERETGIIFLTLQGKGDLNLIDEEAIFGLGRALKEIEGDTDVRAVVLEGFGEKAFSAGVDVRIMKEFLPQNAERFIRSLHSVMSSIMKLPYPVIASIKGPCLGGGLEFALACDIRVAANDALFGLPEIRVGIPSVIEASLLPRIIGWGKARELILTGETIKAQEAYQLGLVNCVVPQEKLREECVRIARRFVNLSPFILGIQKDILNKWLELGHEQAIEYSIKAFATCFTTPHPREGMEAFLQKKEPCYPA